MSASGSRCFISLVMVLLFPLSLFAADTGAAILHTRGGVWVNGTEVADSTAIFPGDSLETKSGFVANLSAEGSSVLIQGESVVKFQGNYLVLEHGSVAVGTSTSMSVHVDCLSVEPISNDRTQYDVTNLTGKVEVAARTNDVNIKPGGALHKSSAERSTSQSATGREGHDATRDETIACGAPPRPEGAGGGGINTKWIEVGAGVGGGGLLLCLLLCKGSTSPPASPSQP